MVLIVVLTSVIFHSCGKKEKKMEVQQLDIQGHRGARGLMPENTVPAFLEALKIGVTTLELDLAVTKDKQLLVSHEPYMSAEICLDSLGNEIAKEDELAHNIYQMTYAQVKSFDCGTKIHPRFPDQQKFKVRKPLLKKVVAAANEFFGEESHRKIHYNIEIKSAPQGDDLYHPAPAEFSDLVYDFIQENMDASLVNVQSFDFRVLQYFHEIYPDIVLAVLIENNKSIEENLNDLGFIPEIYSCDFKLLKEKDIVLLQEKNMKVIPWTVNEIDDMQRLIDWGVDGIITDYPDRLMTLISQK